MGGLSLSQWLKLLAEAPGIIAEVKTALPVLMPIVKRITALVHELGLDQPQPHETIDLPDAVKKIVDGKLSPEEQAIYDRMSGNIG